MILITLSMLGFGIWFGGIAIFQLAVFIFFYYRVRTAKKILVQSIKMNSYLL